MPADAQQAPLKKHRFGIGVGLVREASVNEHVSSLRYQDTYVTTRAGYHYKGVRHWHRLVFSYGRNRLTSRITEGPVHLQKGWQFRLRGGYALQVASFGNGGSGLFAGMLVDNRFQRRRHYYLEPIAEWFSQGYSALNLAASTRFRRGRTGEFVLEAAVPVVALVVRSPYAVKGRLRQHWATVDGFLGVSGQIAYEHTLSSSFALRAAWLLDAYRIDAPVLSRTLDYAFSLGLHIRR